MHEWGGKTSKVAQLTWSNAGWATWIKGTSLGCDLPQPGVTLFDITFPGIISNWPAQKSECQLASWWLWILFWDTLTHALGINLELNLYQTEPGTTKWVPGQLQLACAEWWLSGDKSEWDTMIRIRARKPKSSFIFPAFLEFEFELESWHWKRHQYLMYLMRWKGILHITFLSLVVPVVWGGCWLRFDALDNRGLAIRGVIWVTRWHWIPIARTAPSRDDAATQIGFSCLHHLPPPMSRPSSQTGSIEADNSDNFGPVENSWATIIHFGAEIDLCHRKKDSSDNIYLWSKIEMYIYCEMLSKPNIFLNTPEQMNHPTNSSIKVLPS